MKNDTQSVADSVEQTADDVLPKAETRALWSDVAIRSATRLIRTGILDSVLNKIMTPQARQQTKPNSLGISLIGMAAARIATRSVPGALLVGAGLLGKAMFDRGRKTKAAADTKVVDPDQQTETIDQ